MCPNKTLCKFRNTHWSESFFWRLSLKKLFRYSIEISDVWVLKTRKKRKNVFYLLLQSTKIKGKFRTKNKIKWFEQDWLIYYGKLLWKMFCMLLATKGEFCVSELTLYMIILLLYLILCLFLWNEIFYSPRSLSHSHLHPWRSFYKYSCLLMSNPCFVSMQVIQILLGLMQKMFLCMRGNKTFRIG